MASKCVNCGAPSYGPGCPKSTNGLHQHNHDEKRCIYCGSTSYGNGCLQTPTRVHVHGPGMKCKYCGSMETGTMRCPYSPIGKHER